MNRNKLLELSKTYFDQHPETIIFYAIEDGNFFKGDKYIVAEKYAKSKDLQMHMINRSDLFKPVYEEPIVIDERTPFELHLIEMDEEKKNVVYFPEDIEFEEKQEVSKVKRKRTKKNKTE